MLFSSINPGGFWFLFLLQPRTTNLVVLNFTQLILWFQGSSSEMCLSNIDGAVNSFRLSREQYVLLFRDDGPLAVQGLALLPTTHSSNVRPRLPQPLYLSPLIYFLLLHLTNLCEYIELPENSTSFIIILK